MVIGIGWNSYLVIGIVSGWNSYLFIGIFSGWNSYLLIGIVMSGIVIMEIKKLFIYGDEV